VTHGCIVHADRFRPVGSRQCRYNVHTGNTNTNLNPDLTVTALACCSLTDRPSPNGRAQSSASRLLACACDAWGPPHTAQTHTSLPTTVYSTTYGGVGWLARPPHHPTLSAVCRHCGRGEGDYWGLHLVPPGWMHALLATRGRSPSELSPVAAPPPVGLHHDGHPCW
jgi:hypothetical protein